MIGKYIVTKHALERYSERTNESKQPTLNRILRDLHATRGKKFVYIGDTVYCFYTQPNTNVREFIMKQRNGKYYITTIINRNRKDSDLAYKNRLKQKEKYEKNLK